MAAESLSIGETAISLMERTLKGFEIFAARGSPTFDLSIFSKPADAIITYRRLGEGYETYSHRTDIAKVAFPLAKWFFRVDRYGCKGREQQVDPFVEDDIKIDIELRCKH